MTTEYLALSNGTGLSYVKYTVSYQDLQALANGLSGAVNLFILPQASAIVGVKVHHTVAFAGPAITAMTVSLGSPISATEFTAAQNVFQAPGDTVLQETALFKAGQFSAAQVSATFTATGANANLANAGSVDIYVLCANVSTPGA